MNIQKVSLFALFFTGLLQATTAPVKDPVEYVHTLQGTNSKIELTKGNTYPHDSIIFWYEILDAANWS